MAKTREAPKARPRRDIATDSPGESPRPSSAAKKKVVKKVVVRKVVKKTKKKTKVQEFKEAWQPDRVEQSAGAYVDAIMDRLQKEKGDPDIVMIGSDETVDVGIPFPSFSLEYLFGITVYPLGRIVMVVGPEASVKSGFVFEITRWFKESAGHAFTLESESKFSKTFAQSIIGYEYARATGLVPCDGIDDWQSHMQAIFSELKLRMIGTKTNKGPGMVWPVHMTVDSIMGKSMMESQHRIEKKGHAGRDHPVEAQSITKFMRKIPQDIRRWPFAITAVNHLKAKKTEQGFLIRDKPGGMGLNFQETFEIEMARVKRMHMKDYEVLRLRMKCAKSSLGIDQRSILVDVLFWDEPADADNPDGSWRQKTVFNWHGATIDLLLGMEGSERKRWAGDKDVDDPGVLDLHRQDLGNKGKGVWSKTLGIPKTDPVSFAEAGAILSDNDEVMLKLRHHFGIKIFREFEPGVDYRITRGAAKKKIREKLR